MQLHVVVHELCRQGKAAIKEGNTLLVKLGDPHISELDIGVYTLEHNEQTLTRHIEELETEKRVAVREAKMCVSKNMRQAVSSQFIINRTIHFRHAGTKLGPELIVCLI
jgi:hypothetical protein